MERQLFEHNFVHDTCRSTWGFSKLRGTLFWASYNKDSAIWGTALESHIFGNPQGLKADRLNSQARKSSLNGKASEKIRLVVGSKPFASSMRTQFSVNVNSVVSDEQLLHPRSVWSASWRAHGNLNGADFNS